MATSPPAPRLKRPMTNGPAEPRRRGEAATAMLLSTALEMGIEAGFDTLTIEALAERSGIAKTTIYRRWPNVSTIVMDAFLAKVNEEAPLVGRSTARASFTASAKRLVRFYRGRDGDTMRTLVGRAQLDPVLRSALMAGWVEPRRRVARQIVSAGIASGELRPDTDADLLIDLVYGPIYHHHLVPYTTEPLTARYVDALVDTVFTAFATPRSTRSRAIDRRSAPR